MSFAHQLLLLVLIVITQCQYLLIIASSLTFDESIETSGEIIGGAEWSIHKRILLSDSKSTKKKSTKTSIKVKSKSKSCKKGTRIFRQRLFDIASLISCSESLSDPSSPQRKALDWLLSDDTFADCQTSSKMKSFKTIIRRIKTTSKNEGLDKKSLKKSKQKDKTSPIAAVSSLSSSLKNKYPSSPSFHRIIPVTQAPISISKSNHVDTKISSSSSSKSRGNKSFKKISSRKSLSKKSNSNKKTKTSPQSQNIQAGTKSNKSSKGSKNAFKKEQTSKKINKNPSSITNADTAPSPSATTIIGPSAYFPYMDQDDAILQRYVLGVFYFSTNGDETWERCGRNSKMTCDELIGAGKVCLNNSLKRSWLSASHECDWGGIECKSNGKSVHRIDFVSNSISGSLPSELASLSRSLKVLNIEGAMNVDDYWRRGEHKYLSGTIPTELGRLSNLKALNLNFNKLTGSLPTELFKLKNLIQLDLNENFISSTIPRVIGNLVHLRYLQLESNRLEGTLPKELGLLTRLEVVTLWNNSLNGNVPMQLCNLRNNFTSQHRGEVGVLDILEADCFGKESILGCGCCSRCF